MSREDGRPDGNWMKTMPCKCGRCRFKPLETRTRCPEIDDFTTAKESDWLWAIRRRGNG